MSSDPSAYLLGAYHNLLNTHLPPQATVCIALSGGMDSAALLHAALQQRQYWYVCACHVNHGISARADGWETFCRQLCAAASVPIHVYRYRPPPGGGSENWARRKRLQAFAQVQADAILLAHHADDQTETVLLRLMRGSGVHGMAAMDSYTQHNGISILRPWLAQPRRRIADYAATQQLRWIEDEDNRNSAQRRNFLRHDIIPLLVQAFPGGDKALAGSGQRLRTADTLLQQLAALDTGTAQQADGGVALSHFHRVGQQRLRNWLYYTANEKQQTVSERQISDLAEQLLHCQTTMTYRFDNLMLSCWRQALYWHRVAPPAADTTPQPLAAQAACVQLPTGGQLVLTATTGRGLSLAKIGKAMQLCPRHGGERLRPPGQRTHTVKKLLQQAHMPPWWRQHYPLLFVGTELAALPGVAVAAQFAATESEPAIECRVEWQAI